MSAVVLVLVAASCTARDARVGAPMPTASIQVSRSRLFPVHRGITEACRYSAASAQWRALCPTELPRPFVGTPPFSGAGIDLTRRPPAMSIGYGAPTEGGGSLVADNLWRNRPCCFLHMDIQREHVYGPPLWRPEEGAPAALGGRRGWLQPPSGANYAGGEYWGNHWRFFFEEAGEHYVVTLHDYGPDTRALLGDIVAGLQPAPPLPSPLPTGQPRPCRTVGGTTICRRGPVAGIAMAGQAIWETRSEEHEIVARDRRGRPLHVIRARYPDELAAADEGVWAIAWKRDDVPLLEIDPRTGRVVRRYLLGRVSAAGLAIGFDSAWVTDDWRDTVTRVDLGSGNTTTIPVGEGPSAIAATEDAVWVANTAAGTVARIDPESDQVIATVEVGAYPQAIEPYGNGMWVAATGDGTISRIDGDANVVVESQHAGVYPLALALAGTCLWVADYASDAARCRGPALGEATDRVVRAGPGPFELEATAHALWIATREGVLRRSL